MTTKRKAFKERNFLEKSQNPLTYELLLELEELLKDKERYPF